MRLRIAVALGAAGFLAAAAPAGAAVTTSNITAPGSPSFLISDAVMPNTITVSGTTDGTTGDHVDIKCYRGVGSRTLTTGLAVAADGSFTFTGSFSSIADRTCVLRAVPAGNSSIYTPGSASAFSGPTLALGMRSETKVGSGPNGGALEYYGIYGSQLLGGFDYYSLGNCSISDSYTYDATTFASATLDYCNDWLSWENGQATAGFATPTRSEFQVDGADAFLPGNVSFLFPTAANNSGFPSLTYSYSIDPATGNLVINETDQVVKCSPGGAFPPTSGNCASFTPVGVQVQMRITQGQGGRVATVTQWMSSTDGQPHAVDLLEDNEFRHINADGQLNFPWTGAGFAPYTTPGQVIPGPGSAPGSFLVKGSAAVPDGGESSPQGAVTFSNAPDSVTVIGTTNNASDYSWFDLGYRRTVPATGSLTLGFTYSNAFLASEVNADAAAAEASYRPAVAISTPASGTTTSQSHVNVSGTASDATGLASLTVNGQSVPVAANGTWSASLPLGAGANTISAKATNVFGNSSQAQTAVTYAPVAPTPAAPKLSLVGQPKLGASGASLSLACQAPAGQTCSGAATLTTTEKIQLPGNKVLTLSAHNPHKRIRSRIVVVGAARFTVAAGQTKTVSVSLNSTGKKLLSKFGRLPVTLTVTFTAANGQSSTVVRTKSTIKQPQKHKKKHH
jgi:hypothetical protein